MRYRWRNLLMSCGLLTLAACGKAADPAPTEQAAKPAAASTASASAVSADAQALLDGLVAPQQSGKYAPRDECGKLPGAGDFRRALAGAVLARDAGAVAGMAVPEVRLGFGGDDGRQRLRAKLGENGGELFREIEALLRLGCAADAQGGITMPWFFAQDYGDVDSYSAMLVTGADVPLLAAPDAGSAVTQKVGWDLVMLDKGLLPDQPFQQVTALGGAKGYVASDKLRSMLDYRLLATPEDGVWKISALVAGD